MAINRNDFDNCNQSAVTEPAVLEQYWKDLQRDGVLTQQLRQAGALSQTEALKDRSKQGEAKKIISCAYPKQMPPPSFEAWLRAVLKNSPISVRRFIAEEQFRQFLRTKGIQGDNLRRYIWEFSERKHEPSETIADYVQRDLPGLFIDGTLLLLVSKEAFKELKKLKKWWNVKLDIDKFKKKKTYMEKFIEFIDWKKGSQDPDTTQSLHKPVHGFRLTNLYDLFKECTHARGNDLKESFMRMLGLRDDSPFSLDEKTQEFSKMRESILNQPPQEADKALLDILRCYHVTTEFWGQKIMEFLCQSMPEILRGYKDSMIPYNSSLFAVADDIFTEENNAEPITDLIWGVLRDCADENVSPNSARGESLCSPYFFRSELLAFWLRKNPPEANILDILLTPEFYLYLDEKEKSEIENPKDQSLTIYLMQAAFQNAAKPSGRDDRDDRDDREWADALRFMDIALEFPRRYPALVKSGFTVTHRQLDNYFEAVDPFYRAGNDITDSIWYAKQLLKKARLRLEAPALGDPYASIEKHFEQLGTFPLLDGVTEDDKRDKLSDIASSHYRGVNLNHAMVAVRTATDILLRKQDERMGSKSDLYNAFLLDAEIIRAFAEYEIEEFLLGNVVETYIRPCRISLQRASNLTREVGEEDRQRLNDLIQACYCFFFKDTSPLVQRLRLLDSGEQEIYQREQNEWMPPQAERIPTIIVYKGCLPSADQQHPIFSGVFDSKYAKDENHQSAVELALIQMILSSRTVVLQPNQVVDNRAILRLMREVPGFNQLCRKGTISISLYGGYTRLSDYLRDCLRKDIDGFRFSNTEALQSTHARGCMIRYLFENEANALRDIPEADRAQVVMVGESYRLIDDLFQRFDIQRMHQNQNIRVPNWNQADRLQLKLPDVLLARLENLLAESREPGSRKSEAMLQRMLDFAKPWEKHTTRTEWDMLIEDALYEAQTDEDRMALTKLEKAVTDAYIISNGRLSCKEVTLVADGKNDEDLILRGKTEQNAESTVCAKFLLEQVRRKKEDAMISWFDVPALASIIREIDSKDADIRQSEDYAVALRERYTGIEYEPLNDGKAFFAACVSAATTAGNYVVSPLHSETDPEDSDAQYDVNECH